MKYEQFFYICLTFLLWASRWSKIETSHSFVQKQFSDQRWTEIDEPSSNLHRLLPSLNPLTPFPLAVKAGGLAPSLCQHAVPGSGHHTLLLPLCHVSPLNLHQVLGSSHASHTFYTRVTDRGEDMSTCPCWVFCATTDLFPCSHLRTGYKQIL